MLIPQIDPIKTFRDLHTITARTSSKVCMVEGLKMNLPEEQETAKSFHLGQILADRPGRLRIQPMIVVVTLGITASPSKVIPTTTDKTNGHQSRVIITETIAMPT